MRSGVGFPTRCQGREYPLGLVPDGPTQEVERGWRATSEGLLAQGQPELAAHVRRFLDSMPRVSKERESIASDLGKFCTGRCAR